MSFTALALHVAATWLILTITGWALAPTAARSQPPLLQCLSYFLCGSVAMAVLGAAVVAFDLGSIETHVALWLCVGSALAMRWRSGGFANSLPATGSLASLRVYAAPLLLAIAFGAHSLSVVHRESYGEQPDWLQISKRSYRLLDGDLQYRVADAFLHDESVEMHFLDAGLVWSAGDRPMLVAAIYTAYSRLLGEQNLALYRLTVILFASVVLLAILALLRFVLAVPPPQALWITVVAAFHPFIYANVEYTWPKMTGVAFALSGFVLIVRAMREKSNGTFWLGATGLALAPLCHGTLLIGVGGLVLTAAWLTADVLPSRTARSLHAAMALIPTVALLLVQSTYNAQQTRSSQLGIRIALCSEGSALYKTPPMTLGEACAKYRERKGIVGFVVDRVANLKQVFLLDTEAWTPPYRGARSAARWLRVYHEQTLQVPLYSAGIASPFVALAMLIGWIFPRSRRRMRDARPMVSILAVAWLTTLAFAIVMSETSELTSRGIPFTQPVLIFVVTAAMLIQWAPRIAMGLLGAHAAIGFTLVAWDEPVFGFIPDGSLFLCAAIFLGLGVASLYEDEGPSPKRDGR